MLIIYLQNVIFMILILRRESYVWCSGSFYGSFDWFYSTIYMFIFCFWYFRFSSIWEAVGVAKIYLPSEYLNKPCYQVNQNYIRVFETTHNNSSNIVYDIYINQDYQVRRNTASYNSNTICDNINSYTDDVYYRTDFSQILIIFTILCIFCFLIPLKLFLRLFRM